MDSMDFLPKEGVARRVMLLWGAVLPLSIFSYLAHGVLTRRQFAFDGPVLLFLHEHAFPLADQFMLFFSQIGSSLVVVPVSIGVFVCLLLRRMTSSAFFWALCVGGTYLLNRLEKLAFARARPDLWVSISPESSFSFPSGHAMHSMAFACALAVLSSRTRWKWHVLALLVPFVAFVGASRVYLGVHYPSDILAGWMMSLSWVIGLNFAFDPDLLPHRR
jgi:membrane-associated phospholipid phosphatase